MTFTIIILLLKTVNFYIMTHFITKYSILIVYFQNIFVSTVRDEKIFKYIQNFDISFFNIKTFSPVDQLYVSSTLLNNIFGPFVNNDIEGFDHKFIYYDIKFNNNKLLLFTLLYYLFYH